MDQLFESGHIVDLIAGFMVLEIVALLLFRRMTGRGFGFFDILTLMLPGLALLLALRAALLGAAWEQIAVWLLVALVAHVGDLGRRLKLI